MLCCILCLNLTRYRPATTLSVTGSKLLDFLLVFILYLSFSQKPHHRETKKISKKNFLEFQESESRSSKSRSTSFPLLKETKEKAERESLGGLPNTETSSQ